MDPVLPRPAPPRSPVERLREWVVWFGPGRLAASGLAALAMVAAGTWLLKASPARPEDNLPFASKPAAAAASAAVTGVVASSSSVVPSLVVHVAGAVVVPGVYTLNGSARVDEAIGLAGGITAEADVNAINLAALVHDGERVYVPKTGEAVPVVVGPAAGAPGAAAPPGPVDVNSATAEQLDVLPGVGPATAAAIVAHRQQHGPFVTVDQLGDVRGIGPAKLDALRGLVTV